MKIQNNKPTNRLIIYTYSVMIMVLIMAGCDNLTDFDHAETLQSQITQSETATLNNAQSRVDVCHVNGKGEYNKITIATAAFESHIDHGDGEIGGDVPGMEGYIFDGNCEPMELGFFIIEDFESGNLDAYTFVGENIVAVVAAEFAHDGEYGLGITDSAAGSGWIYRNDSQVYVKQGDVISVWVKFDNILSGRGYFGFGASDLGTLSFVVSPNTSDIRLQLNVNYNTYNELNSSPQIFQADKWYRAEVVWGTDGSITGNLYDSDGATLLSSVSDNSTVFSEGGIAFRGFAGFKAFDTVEVFR